MHYGIVAIGSRGDVQPYMALALGLMDRGHKVTLMAHENFKAFVEGFGISFYPLEGDVENILHSAEAHQVLQSGRFIDFARYMQKNIERTKLEVTRDIWAGSENADVLVSSLLALPWIFSIAEKMHKKWAIVQLNLPTVPTAAFPLAAIDFFDFPAFNKLSYRLFEIFHWLNNKKPVNEFRQRLGLAPLKTPIIQQIADQKILNIYCFSPALRARPSDWPSQADITGFLFLPKEKRKINPQEDIPPALLRWMEDGHDPIYIGFGSIPIPDPKKFERILTDILNSTTHRFIFCQGWSMPMDLPMHTRLFQIKSVNHEWLFPRCRAAITHGGVGTTAAVLRAGIPLIIVSIIADQPWMGKIIEAKLTGVHIPFRKLTKEKLLSAIADTETVEMRREAFRLGEQIRRENGLKKTIDHLEKYFCTD